MNKKQLIIQWFLNSISTSKTVNGLRILSFSFLLISCNLFVPGPNEPFYCKINGKKFVPEKSNCCATVGTEPLQMTWNENSGGLTIRARNNPFGIFLVIVFDDKKIKEGKIILSNDLLKSKAYFTPNRNIDRPEDLISTEGFIEITKKDGYILSGTFEFKVYSDKEKKEYKVTKGEFNKLSYYL